jgi:hypothetical protein
MKLSWPYTYIAFTKKDFRYARHSGVTRRIMARANRIAGAATVNNALYDTPSHHNVVYARVEWYKAYRAARVLTRTVATLN